MRPSQSSQVLTHLFDKVCLHPACRRSVVALPVSLAVNKDASRTWACLRGLLAGMCFTGRASNPCCWNLGSGSFQGGATRAWLHTTPANVAAGTPLSRRSSSPSALAFLQSAAVDQRGFCRPLQCCEAGLLPREPPADSALSDNKQHLLLLLLQNNGMDGMDPPYSRAEWFLTQNHLSVLWQSVWIHIQHTSVPLHSPVQSRSFQQGQVAFNCTLITTYKDQTLKGRESAMRLTGTGKRQTQKHWTTGQLEHLDKRHSSNQWKIRMKMDLNVLQH